MHSLRNKLPVAAQHLVRRVSSPRKCYPAWYCVFFQLKAPVTIDNRVVETVETQGCLTSFVLGSLRLSASHAPMSANQAQTPRIRTTGQSVRHGIILQNQSPVVLNNLSGRITTQRWHSPADACSLHVLRLRVLVEPHTELVRLRFDSLADDCVDRLTCDNEKVRGIDHASRSIAASVV